MRAWLQRFWKAASEVIHLTLYFHLVSPAIPLGADAMIPLIQRAAMIIKANPTTCIIAVPIIIVTAKQTLENWKARRKVSITVPRRRNKKKRQYRLRDARGRFVSPETQRRKTNPKKRSAVGKPQQMEIRF